MIYLTKDVAFKPERMGSRFARCLGIAPKVRTTVIDQEIHDGTSHRPRHNAVALSLDKSENENPTEIGLDWNEV